MLHCNNMCVNDNKYDVLVGEKMTYKEYKEKLEKLKNIEELDCDECEYNGKCGNGCKKKDILIQEIETYERIGESVNGDMEYDKRKEDSNT